MRKGFSGGVGTDIYDVYEEKMTGHQGTLIMN